MPLLLSVTIAILGIAVLLLKLVFGYPVSITQKVKQYKTYFAIIEASIWEKPYPVIKIPVTKIAAVGIRILHNVIFSFPFGRKAGFTGASDFLINQFPT